MFDLVLLKDGPKTPPESKLQIFWAEPIGSSRSLCELDGTWVGPPNELI